MAKAPERTHKTHGASKPSSTISFKASRSRQRLMKNTPSTARLPRPACRSRIRSARNGILARAAFRLFGDKSRLHRDGLRTQPAMTDLPRIRKRPLDAEAHRSGRAADEIDIASCATVAYSSEDPANPVEHLLDGPSGPGATRWMSARPDTVEHIVLEF